MTTRTTNLYDLSKIIQRRWRVHRSSPVTKSTHRYTATEMKEVLESITGMSLTGMKVGLTLQAIGAEQRQEKATGCKYYYLSRIDETPDQVHENPKYDDNYPKAVSA